MYSFSFLCSTFASPARSGDGDLCSARDATPHTVKDRTISKLHILWVLFVPFGLFLRAGTYLLDENIQKYLEKPKSGMSNNGFQLAEGVDGCARDGRDIAETDAFLEET